MRNVLLGLGLLTLPLYGQLQSPNQSLQLDFDVTSQGKMNYQVGYRGQTVLEPSQLGFVFKNGRDLTNGWTIQSREFETVNENWQPVLGEESTINNHYREMAVRMVHTATNIEMVLRFRAFAEGVAFRYEFPKQPALNHFVIAKETTSFDLTQDYKAQWIPADFDSQEYPYLETQLSEVDPALVNMNNGIGFKNLHPKPSVQSPLQLKSKDGLYVNVFEAAVINYPVMHLEVDKANFELKALFAPNAIGDLAYLQAPFSTPWRTIMVSKDAREIVASKMILNLNDPSKIADVSWIKPMKYVGVWWEMHVNQATWDLAGSQSAHNVDGKAIVKKRHGANTENVKRYIDFAAKHGFDGVLVEGWNEGWEDWAGNWKEDVFDFITPYPDFDVVGLQKYAKEKGVQMIMHHETSGSTANYERWLDRAFAFMKQHDYHAVKTGYVGPIIPRGEAHDGQSMVNHFLHVVKRAADYQIMVNSHESSRPTGVHRTYPNYIAAEAARGNEFNAWSTGNPPAHETILPFTRLLGGPMDYTPGIFETKMSTYEPGKSDQVRTTIAKQLALYVTLYSPLQMAADLLENYEKHLDAFKFIKDVALDWEKSIYLEAEPGDYVTVARKDKHSQRWFLGAITDENPRKTSVKLDFLTPGKTYRMTVYQDGKNAHWDTNPKAYTIYTKNVTSRSNLNLQLAASGGAAVVFEPIN